MCKMGWTGAINAKVRATKSRRNFFETSPPVPAHRTLNSSFGTFHSVRVHLRLFCYGSKLGAKWAELVQLMQKYMPWSHIRIIRNKCTRSTALDPNIMFWCISYCLGAFGIIFLLQETRCRMGWSRAINAKVRAMKLRRSFSQRTHPIHPIGP